MKSVFEYDINIPREKLARLYANPDNNIKWMHDLKKLEPISGKTGQPGFRYRLIPKEGNMIFDATVVSRNLPDELKLNLEGSKTNVFVTGKFIALSRDKTKFISEEVFTFRGFFNKISGFLSRRAIKKAHQTHMNDFIKFAITKK